ncbi:MAG: AcrR family transcriptional regulator [Flavobacteriales bacterium]|jgi:AcrR family transcriptional regulator
MKSHKIDILDKSKELFQRFGYQKTTLTDIAKSVGKVKTAVYYYFSGKEEIFAALIQSEAEDFLIKLKKEVALEKDATKKLEKYVAARIQLMQKVATKYNFLKKEFFELMPLVEVNRANSFQEEIKWVEELMIENNKKGLMITELPTFSSVMLVQSLKGLEIQMYVTDQLIVEKDNLQSFINYILYGVLQKSK